VVVAGKQPAHLDLFTRKAMDRIGPVDLSMVTLDAIGRAGQLALDISLSINGELQGPGNA
jgi:2-keto-4-pentenoate hydratase/2-oxohepta-3-ene-1,7-dioic acid hydratase in catechol pathway